ncbi:glycoside hydrolase family 127 protein [Sphingomonas sp. BK580]|uniref:glycoside hydrolase family 127 protein n=1 Tax=Sphingomonas sp. BK580 TaxID=2586972 RepID=UPI001607BA52|nr:beta-L-arabinofuranosidase domain-containing protein [Sphingomonas sp. BK580]MBB3695247.1 DUF1680 family protein [Sphingomonas sp. BK580]
MPLSRRDLLLHGSAFGLAAALRPDASDALPAPFIGADPTTGGALQPVPISDVVIDDSFWAPKRRIWRDVTIPDCLTKFETDRGGAFANFDKVSTRSGGTHAGDPWMDGLVYEMIRAAADFILADPNPELALRLEGYAKRIAAAAATRADGYVNTYTQLVEPGHEWGDDGGVLVWQHDVYNLGALIDAAVRLQHATGSTTLLVPAVRIANTMCALMGPPPKRNIVPAHPLPEEALVRLHEFFVERPALAANLPLPVASADYLKLAEFWIESRGRNSGTPDWDKDRPAAERFVRERRQGSDRPSWGAYAQDHAPVFEQHTIEGHAVRATLLCAGIAAAARINGDDRYRRAALRLWENMVHRRMHVTGGVGAYAQEEKFGPDFALPNDAYLETCAAVGAGFFHRNMNLLFGDARFADELERVLYNGALSGVSLEGTSYLYQNPLESDASRARWQWHTCPCCPPMFLKLMGAMPGYVYATRDREVYVNLFVGGRATIHTPDGPVKLRQVTDYPWSGRVEFVIDQAPASPLSLLIRRPGWCETALLTINGTPADASTGANGYVALDRRWRPGDVVRLDMPMPVRVMHADPRVKSATGRVALMRGPIVYCMESRDLPDLATSAVVPSSFSPRRTVELGGVVVLDGFVSVPSQSASALYGPSGGARVRSKATAIPYFANLNRGPVDMAVWLPV